MLTNEAKWIGHALAAMPTDAASPCLNLGSSTAHFRNVSQPWIVERVIAPAEARGVRFIHADLKGVPGVDMAGNVFDQNFQGQLAAQAPGSILCCNMFEHVVDRQRLADICTKMVRPGGRIIVSVPRSFPYHPDPIDSYFRPTPEEIAALFPRCKVIASEIIWETTYWHELQALSIAERISVLAKSAVHLFMPFYKWDRWKGRLHPLLWLFRRYRVSIVVLQRDDGRRPSGQGAAARLPNPKRQSICND